MHYALKSTQNAVNTAIYFAFQIVLLDLAIQSRLDGTRNEHISKQLDIGQVAANLPDILQNIGTAMTWSQTACNAMTQKPSSTIWSQERSAEHWMSLIWNPKPQKCAEIIMQDTLRIQSRTKTNNNKNNNKPCRLETRCRRQQKANKHSSSHYRGTKFFWKTRTVDQTENMYMKVIKNFSFFLTLLTTKHDSVVPLRRENGFLKSLPFVNTH